MRISGNMFRLMPGLREYSFSIDGVSTSNSTGLSSFGFSGSGNSISFTIQNGKIYDANNKYVSSLNSGESVAVSGDVSTGFLQYFLNGERVGYLNKNDFPLQKFFVNSSGCYTTLFPILKGNIDVSLFDVEMQDSFYAGSSLTGRVVNNSPFDAFVFSSRMVYSDATKATLSGRISGQVSSSNSLPFSFYDSGSSEFSTRNSFRLLLDTSLGSIEKSFVIERLSNLTGDIFLVNDSLFSSSSIPLRFSGDIIPNKFLYTRPDSGQCALSLNYRRFDRTGLAKNKSVSWYFQPTSPTGITVNTGSFLTGYRVLDSGFYSEMPSVSFVDYGMVTGASYNTRNLFSLGCGSSIPLLFVAESGLGISGTGTALLKSVQVPLYGSRSFYSITGIRLDGEGSGYMFPPYIDLLTGDIGPDCFDVPRESGNSYIYSPFTGTGILKKQASYLYGTPLTGRRVKTISGQPYTGWAVTGLQFGNIGSGFNNSSGLVPSVSFIRSYSDLYLGAVSDNILDASGTFLYNTSGETYSFTGNWIFKTGLSPFSLREVSSSTYYGGLSGYSGSVSLNFGETNFHALCIYKQTSHSYYPTIRAGYSLDDSHNKSVIVTGIYQLSTYSGMLNPAPETNTGIFIEF